MKTVSFQYFTVESLMNVRRIRKLKCFSAQVIIQLMTLNELQ